MADLIAKRNLKFVEAVNELLLACAAHEPVEDPVGLLLAATQDHLPAMPQPEDGEGRNKGLKEKRGDLDFYVRNPDQRMSVEQMIKEVKVEDWYVDQIVDGGHRQVPPRKAVVGELEHPLSQALWDALYATKKISSLYSHQAEALNAIDGGKSVIVSTSTASGKSCVRSVLTSSLTMGSLIYQVPIIKALENDPSATALFIFPTKALAQDQKRSLSELLSNYEAEALRSVKVATFDGDTPKEDRDYIRENASVIFTNPDTLHITLLPREEQWRRFFRHLRFVVVDGELVSSAEECADYMCRDPLVCRAVRDARCLYRETTATNLRGDWESTRPVHLLQRHDRESRRTHGGALRHRGRRGDRCRRLTERSEGTSGSGTARGLT